MLHCKLFPLSGTLLYPASVSGEYACIPNINDTIITPVVCSFDIFANVQAVRWVEELGVRF